MSALSLLRKLASRPSSQPPSALSLVRGLISDKDGDVVLDSASVASDDSEEKDEKVPWEALDRRRVAQRAIGGGMWLPVCVYVRVCVQPHWCARMRACGCVCVCGCFCYCCEH